MVEVEIELNADNPFWQPVPSAPGGIILHWSDPWGNGDLYETATGDWFLWRGSLGDYPKLGKPWATAISVTQARKWLKAAQRRQRDRAMRENDRAIEEERVAEAKRKRDEERQEYLRKVVTDER